MGEAPCAQGTSVERAQTELNRLGILVQGDLFSPAVVEKLDRRLDLLLVTMSRSFCGRSLDPEHGLREERQAYLDALERAGIQTVPVNLLGTDSGGASFGGALVVSAAGEPPTESPHRTGEMLVWDPRERQ
jgi:hypothetical protein